MSTRSSVDSQPTYARRGKTPSAELPQAIVLAPGDGGLAVARSLSRRGVAVSMLGDRAWRWTLRTRKADGFELGQLPAAEEEWLATLERLAEQGDGVLISCSDRVSEFIARERGRIPANLRSFESPESSHVELMDKGFLYALAKRTGVRYPWSLTLSSHEQLDAVAAEADFPCLLKPVLSHHWRRLFGEHRVLPVRDREDLARLAGPPLDAGLELLVTEHIPGPDQNIESVVALRVRDGSCPLRFGTLKHRQYPAGFGAGGMVESAAVPETVALAARLIEPIGFVGLLMVETKRSAETGEVALIEVNVRVPQYFGLGDGAGVDASWRLYATLAGLALDPQPPQVPGAKVIVPSLEPRAVVDSLRTGRTTAREVLASYRGVRSFSGLALDDPAPALSLTAQDLAPAARFLRQRSR
jgi:D-aspartate ligase